MHTKSSPSIDRDPVLFFECPYLVGSGTWRYPVCVCSRMEGREVECEADSNIMLQSAKCSCFHSYLWALFSQLIHACGNNKVIWLVLLCQELLWWKSRQINYLFASQNAWKARSSVSVLLSLHLSSGRDFHQLYIPKLSLEPLSTFVIDAFPQQLLSTKVMKKVKPD